MTEIGRPLKSGDAVICHNPSNTWPLHVSKNPKVCAKPARVVPVYTTCTMDTERLGRPCDDDLPAIVGAYRNMVGGID